MLVKRGAVEPAQAVGVGREMRRHPVEDDADADLVGAVDEAGKAFRLAEAGGRRIEAGRLVAPGRIVGMFGDRQEFDMGEAHVDAVGDQPRGQSRPRTASCRRRCAARSRHAPRRSRSAGGAGRRLAQCLRWASSSQSCTSSGVVTEAFFGRSSPRRAKGSAFSGSSIAVLADDLEFVGDAGRDVRGEDFPDAGVAAQAHDMAAAVPVVEIADDGDAPGIRRPDGEMEALRRLHASADGRPSCRTGADAEPSRA